jgi:hypothetical protein
MEFVVEIPGLGPVKRDAKLGWYRSKPIPIPLLGRKKGRIIVEDYDEDQKPEEYHVAIANFLSLTPAVLKAAAPYVFQYYEATKANFAPGDREFVPIASASEVFRYVRLGTEPVVTRRAHGDKGIYVSLGCECDWEEEHGLQIVFKNGLIINKVGPYNGHLTNSDAYGSKRLENVIFFA